MPTEVLTGLDVAVWRSTRRPCEALTLRAPQSSAPVSGLCADSQAPAAEMASTESSRGAAQRIESRAAKGLYHHHPTTHNTHQVGGRSVGTWGACAVYPLCPFSPEAPERISQGQTQTRGLAVLRGLLVCGSRTQHHTAPRTRCNASTHPTCPPGAPAHLCTSHPRDFPTHEVFTGLNCHMRLPS